MSLTAPKTWASGDILTAADMNTYVRDNMRWVSGNPATGGKPSCRVFNSTVFTGVSSGFNPTFDTERWDIGAMHDLSTNPDRITVPTVGKYLFGAAVRLALTWANVTTGYAGVQIVANGGTTIAESSSINEWSGGVRDTRYTPVTLFALSAASFTQVSINYTAMSNVNVQASPDYSPEFWAMWLGDS